MIKNICISLISCLLLSACTVGPDYVRPSVVVPSQYQKSKASKADQVDQRAPEAPEIQKTPGPPEAALTALWKIAQPQDASDPGAWWHLFNDPMLNQLETKLDTANTTIQVALANYQKSRALVDEARAGYFPTLSAAVNLTRGTQSSTSSTSSTATQAANHQSGLLNASWEPDLWGNVSRLVEANTFSAQANAAQWAATRLSAQALLAQYYFELQGLDADQHYLDQIVLAYKKILEITRNRYEAGIDARIDILKAQSTLESTAATALNVQMNRAQMEHAIAVLVGEPPEHFSIPAKPLKATPPAIPVGLPSALLERRYDIAQAERQMAAANAQIGVATTAYFPSTTLSGAVGGLGQGSLQSWLSAPLFTWAVGAALAETLFDGGARDAVLAGTQADYEASVATYRGVVLAAFQEVEDNLTALQSLEAQANAQKQAALHLTHVLKLVNNQYQAGTQTASDVLTAQIAAQTAEKSASDVNALRMTAAIGLIKALGGDMNR